jgi:hypothetical protein
VTLIRTLFCVFLLTGCATAPSVIDAKNDPPNPSAAESPTPSATGSLMSGIDAMPTSQDSPGKTSSSDQEMKNMPGMKGMGGMKDMPGMKSNEMPSPAKVIYTCLMGCKPHTKDRIHSLE